MIIRILNEQVREESQTRYVQIVISDGAFPDATHYKLGRGGLPLVGDLQPILEAEEASLWQVAVAKDNQKTTAEVRCLLYNSISEGWSEDDFQEAILEHLAGEEENSERLTAMLAKRAAIRAEWPI